MKENLIFGADITSFGAVGDGKADCTEAFENALNSEHNLITVPFGEYLIKKPLTIGSNTKLHLHPAAKIVFDVKDSTSLVTASNEASSIIIFGGKWYAKGNEITENTYVFDFNAVENLKMHNVFVDAPLFGGVKADGVCDFRFEGVTCNTKDGVNLSECKGGTLRNLTHSGCGTTLTFDGNNDSVFITNIASNNVDTVINADGTLDDVQIYDVCASFEKHLLCINKTAKVNYLLLSGINAYNNASTQNSAYFKLCGSFESMVIENFKRDTDFEATPKVPTLKAHDTSVSIIIDGIALDEIISAKAASKITSMLPARLSDPHGKFVYTLETTVKKGDSFIIPGGRFDTLEVYGH